MKLSERMRNWPEFYTARTDKTLVGIEPRTVDRWADEVAALEQRVEGLEELLDNARNAVSRADAQIGTLIDQTVIYSGAWDELQEALAGESDE